MARKRVRALVLAAGLGTRLRPLTDTVPKPLLPVAGTPILGHTLAALAAAGCEAAAINLHHHPAAIRDFFGREYQGLPLVYSEEPEILGTLGALYPLRDFLAPADLILLLNGDSLCAWPLAALQKAHRAGALATLLVATRPDPAAFGGGVGIDRAGRIVSFRPGDPEAAPAVRRQVFAGAHAFPPRLLERVGPGRADIVRDLYVPLLAERPGSLAALATDRLWHDMGTPGRFLAGALAWVGRRGWRSPDAQVAPGASVRRSIVEAGAQVALGASVEDSLLLPGAVVEVSAAVRGTLVGPGARIPEASTVEGMLVSAAPGDPGAVGRFAPL